MASNSIDYPVLESIESSEYDEKIRFLFESIAHHRLCWMAFEHLEELLSDRKMKKGLLCCKENNTIAIRTKTRRLLARIWFEPKPIENNKTLYKWSTE